MYYAIIQLFQYRCTKNVCVYIMNVCMCVMYVREVVIKRGRTQIAAFDPITEPTIYICGRSETWVVFYFILHPLATSFSSRPRNDSIGGVLNLWNSLFSLLFVIHRRWRRISSRHWDAAAARRIIEFGAPTSSAAVVDKKLNGYVLNLGLET